MNHAIRLVPLLSLACALGCAVPSLDELAEDFPVTEYTCNAQYKDCPEGQLCVEGRCRDTASLACVPQEVKDCYSNVGECRVGKKKCGADATFGACEGGVAPAAEMCDDKDNNCDGTPDNLSAQKILRENAPDSPLDATWVPGTDRGLIALAGPEGIRLRSIGEKGDLLEGDTFAPTAQHRAVAPAIAARNGIALVAWIEPARPEITGDRTRVVVVKVDEKGKQIPGQRIDALHSEHTLPYITNVTLAIGEKHFLALLSTSSLDREPMDGDLANRETWRTTHSLDLTIQSPISELLAIPMERFGLHATAEAVGEGFVVAYENQGARYTVRLSHNDNEVLTPWLLTNDRGSHSPFVSLNPGDREARFVVYARNNPTASTSEIVSTRCTEPATANGPSCGAETDIFKSTKRIRRAWVRGEAGGLGVSHALFSWQDWDTPKPRLAVARFDANGVIQPKQVASIETFGEAFFITPNRLLNAVYLVNPNPADPATLKDAYVQPLCFF